MPNFKLVLEYDGTDFEGWQSQPGDHRTVQDAVARALGQISGSPARVIGAGRTDAGVHAEGQVASVQLDTALTPHTLKRALNGTLPRDVAVRAVTRVPGTFDARRDAISKLYRYRIWNSSTRSPLLARFSVMVQQPLDLAGMRKAAEALLGRHDFASFQAAGSTVKTSVRELTRLDVLGEPGSQVRLEVEGSGFLRHMVRNLAGTLMEVGAGRRDAASLTALLEARDRRLAGPTAGARGLCLVRVDHDPAPGPVLPSKSEA